MNPVIEARTLHLPSDGYVVIGSGILGALGIREVGDLDLLVTPPVFDSLRELGWMYDEVEIEGRIRQRLTRGLVEVFNDFWYGEQSPPADALIAEAVLVDGVPFLPLERVLEIKRAFGRPKDHADVVLIEAYLKGRR